MTIHIKHFMAERDGKDKPPSWKTAEDWLQSLSPASDPSPRILPTILHVKAYPSPTHHNLILIVDDHQA